MQFYWTRNWGSLCRGIRRNTNPAYRTALTFLDLIWHRLSDYLFPFLSFLFFFFSPWGCSTALNWGSLCRGKCRNTNPAYRTALTFPDLIWHRLSDYFLPFLSFFLPEGAAQRLNLSWIDCCSCLMAQLPHLFPGRSWSVVAVVWVYLLWSNPSSVSVCTRPRQALFRPANPFV